MRKMYWALTLTVVGVSAAYAGNGRKMNTQAGFRSGPLVVAQTVGSRIIVPGAHKAGQILTPQNAPGAFDVVNQALDRHPEAAQLQPAAGALAAMAHNVAMAEGGDFGTTRDGVHWDGYGQWYYPIPSPWQEQLRAVISKRDGILTNSPTAVFISDALGENRPKFGVDLEGSANYDARSSVSRRDNINFIILTQYLLRNESPQAALAVTVQRWAEWYLSNVPSSAEKTFTGGVLAARTFWEAAVQGTGKNWNKQADIYRFGRSILYSWFYAARESLRNASTPDQVRHGLLFQDIRRGVDYTNARGANATPLAELGIDSEARRVGESQFADDVNNSREWFQANGLF